MMNRVPETDRTRASLSPSRMIQSFEVRVRLVEVDHRVVGDRDGVGERRRGPGPAG